MKARPAVIVLAAGKGIRTQGVEHKLTQPLGDSTVLDMTLHLALASQLPILVITTPALAERASHHVATRDIVVLSPAEAKAGTGHSIAAGVSARSNASGWVILPGDMPLVRPSTLRAVAHELEHHPVAFAQYRGLRGHPVGFSAELYSELVLLSGDVGARRLVARYPAREVEVDDPGVLVDVDSDDGLSQARAMCEMAVAHLPQGG
jgi:molybdenum cofactor cytidylyltransferase